MYIPAQLHAAMDIYTVCETATWAMYIYVINR